MVIFQYHLYIFVWILHGCLTNMVYAMDPNSSVIKRLWCTVLADWQTTNVANVLTFCIPYSTVFWPIFFFYAFVFLKYLVEWKSVDSVHTVHSV